MAESEKNIVLNVKIIDNYIQAKKNVDQLNAAYVAAKQEVESLQLAIDKLNGSFKSGSSSVISYSKKLAKLENRLTTATQKEEKLVNTIAKSADELGAMQVELKTLGNQLTSATQKEQKLIQTLAESTGKVSDLQAEMAKQVVMNDALAKSTEVANLSIGDMKKHLSALKEASFDGLAPEKIDEIKEGIAKLEAGIKKFEEEIKNMNPREFFDQFSEGFKVIGDGVGILSTLLKAVGADSTYIDLLEKNLATLASTMQTAGAITEFFTQKKHLLIAATIKNALASAAEAVARAKATLAARAAAAGDTMGIAAKIGHTVATGALTVAQWLLNAAVSAFPILLIVAAIAAVFSLFSGSSKGAKEAAKAQEEYNEAVKESERAISDANRELDKKTKKLQANASKEIEAMKQKGATKEEIAARELQLVKDLAKEEEEASLKREKAYSDELDAANKNLKVQEEQLKRLDKGTKEYNEQKAKVDELNESIKNLTANVENEQTLRINIETNVTKAVNADDANKKKEAQEQAKKRAKENRELADDAIKESHTNNLRVIEQEKKDALELANEQYKNREKDFAQQLAYQQAVFNAEDQHKRKMLEQNLKNSAEKANLLAKDINKQIASGEISKSFGEEKIRLLQNQQKRELEDYNNAIEELDKQQQKFANEQIKKAEKEVETLLGSINSLVKKSAKEEIKATENKFNSIISKTKQQASLLKEANKQLVPNSEEYKKNSELIENLKLKEAELEHQLAKEKEQIREDAQKRLLEEFEKDADKLYKKDIEKFAGNEIKKLETELLRLEEIKRRKEEHNKTAGADEQLDTTTDDAALSATRIQLAQATAAKELAIAHGSYYAKYKIKKDLLAKELEEIRKTHGEESKEYAEKVSQQKSLQQEYYDWLMGKIAEYAGQASQAMGSLNEILGNMEAGKLQEAEEQNEKEKEDLKAQLDAKLISQEEYDQKVAESDKNLEKQKAEIARKQAIRDKAMAIFDIGVNTAIAISKAVLAAPLTGGLPFSAIVAALGALQLAAVASKPIPKAARGGLIGGRSHALGGTLIEAEAGEAIINSRSTRAFAPILSAINELGGGVPFARPMSDGGFAQREYSRQSQPSLTASDVRDAMREAVGELKIYTAIEDINDGNRRYAELTDTSIF